MNTFVENKDVEMIQFEETFQIYLKYGAAPFVDLPKWFDSLAANIKQHFYRIYQQMLEATDTDKFIEKCNVLERDVMMYLLDEELHAEFSQFAA